MNAGSKLILGTAQFGMNYGINNSSGKPKKDEIYKILDYAKENGITTLDTANGYGESQRILGEYFKDRGNAFKILSKFALCGASETVAIQIEKTLNELSLDSIDTYSFHDLSNFNEHIVEELLQLKKKKRIRKIGVSVYTNEDVDMASQYEWVDTIQLPFNLFDNWSLRGQVIQRAKQRGKIIHTRSVFLQGIFFKDVDTLTGALVGLKDALNELQHIRKTFAIPIESLALSYALGVPEIDGILLGVDSLQQLIRNIKSLDGVDISKFGDININVDHINLLDPLSWIE